ncbi:hypothetical protein Hypma_016572 [Hypsizygus marmoreus]|uniref:Uncharacterized protein n=1 Tax=Hypsizygus marmoreus TaxID=39966 RepID=A0A369IY14_HYPMA|nr:hypothetical protein Hypma_016572 [Hypsizygus marmoreus]
MYSAVQQCTLRGSREVYRQRTSPMHALLTPDDELNCKRRNVTGARGRERRNMYASPRPAQDKLAPPSSLSILASHYPEP